MSAMGLAAVMAATVIIHPLIFVAGVGTAMWAVGVFHAAEKRLVITFTFHLLLHQGFSLLGH